jgi:nucleotide-binding universal stress UspA family protein
MPTLAKILLPVDFSERSASAAQCARSLAGHFGAEVTVLHVLTPPQLEVGALEISGAMLAELYRGRKANAEADLDDFLKSDLEGITARRLALEGEPASRIVAIAQSEGSDLIIMPTHGYGRFRRFILGSNTAKVLHDADCPVWTGVHMEQRPANPGAVAADASERPIRNVLCGVDLGPQSEKALGWAAMLARKFDARLTVLHTVGSVPEPAQGASGELRGGMGEAAERELARLLRAAGVEAERLVVPGEVAAALCSAAERLRADALVIGRGSASGVFGRLRTNAYAIIRQSPCPVVSV